MVGEQQARASVLLCRVVAMHGVSRPSELVAARHYGCQPVAFLAERNAGLAFGHSWL